MSYLAPWLENSEAHYSDQLKRFIHQHREESRANSLPHVMKPIPCKQSIMGSSSPDQTGGLYCYDILTRAPLYVLTCHFSDIPPQAPLRGVHRHISAPTLMCVSGKGWELNDASRYEFEMYDLLVVPPYTTHQHGGDLNLGCRIYVPKTRMFHVLGVLLREQIQFAEQPTFPEGTEPIKDGQGKLVGYRIKKGILGITEDLEVFLGAQPNTEAVFESRRRTPPWTGVVENTYDRYRKLLHDEVQFCNTVDHVIPYEQPPWEWAKHGRLKWYVHPDTVCSARRVWLYMQEIPPGSRSGKHRHMGEEQILVVSGRGYDIHDGERWNWESGDLISIPPMAVHQHFNTDQENPALIFSSMPSICMDLGLGGIEQLEDAPEFSQA